MLHGRADTNRTGNSAVLYRTIRSGPVGGSVPYVLGFDDVVLGDGGVSSGAVSGRMSDLNRLSGGGDTDVSVVDTVVSGAVSGCLCDLDSVSKGDVVVHVGDYVVVRRW